MFSLFAKFQPANPRLFCNSFVIFCAGREFDALFEMPDESASFVAESEEGTSTTTTTTATTAAATNYSQLAAAEAKNNHSQLGYPYGMPACQEHPILYDCHTHTFPAECWDIRVGSQCTKMNNYQAKTNETCSVRPFCASDFGDTWTSVDCPAGYQTHCDEGSHTMSMDSLYLQFTWKEECNVITTTENKEQTLTPRPPGGTGRPLFVISAIKVNTAGIEFASNFGLSEMVLDYKQDSAHRKSVKCMDQDSNPALTGQNSNTAPGLIYHLEDHNIYANSFKISLKNNYPSESLGISLAFSGCAVDQQGTNMFEGDATEHLFVVDDFPQSYNDNVLNVLQVATNFHQSFLCRSTCDRTF